jgi:hypothetical protein
VRDDRLTGSDLRESTLGKVPAAAQADTAASAGAATNAQQLGSAAAGQYLRGFHVASSTSGSNSEGKTSPRTATWARSLWGGSATLGGSPEDIAHIVIHQVGPAPAGGAAEPAGYRAFGTEVAPDTGNWIITATVSCAKAG